VDINLPSATAILSEAWLIYKRQMMTFLGIASILLVSNLLPTLALSFGVFSLADKFIGSTALIIFIGLASVILLAIIQIWSFLAIVYAIKEQDKALKIRELYRKSWPKVFSSIWIYILTYALLASLFPLILIPFLGIFGLWILFINFSISFSLAIYILVAEDIKGIAAIIKSKMYVNGIFGKILWRYFFIGFVAFLYGIAVIILTLILVYILGPSVSEFAFLPFALFIPLSIIYSYNVYAKVKDAQRNSVFPIDTKRTGYIIWSVVGFIVLIVFVLSAVGFATMFSSDVIKGNGSFQQLGQIFTIIFALEGYYADNNAYPDSLDQLIPVYFEQIPQDPVSQSDYLYRSLDEGQNYELCYAISAEENKCIYGLEEQNSYPEFIQDSNILHKVIYYLAR
jgi:hypothetical protein